MLLVFRTIVYVSVFVGLLFLYLPSRVLAMTGVRLGGEMGWIQVAALILGGVGAILAVACVGSFIGIGKGTPAPFDPPRKLVVRGPYRFARNPMYLGGALILGSVALFYASWWIAAYGAILFICAYLLVIFYEEPTLRRLFGDEYEDYCRRVGRWWRHAAS